MMYNKFSKTNPERIFSPTRHVRMRISNISFALISLALLFGVAIAHSTAGQTQTQNHSHDHDHSHEGHDHHDHSHDSAATPPTKTVSDNDDSQGGFLEKCTFFKDVQKYIETNAPSKEAQVALSILIISFPSIPIFLGLSFLGKILRAKNEKTQFSAKLLNILLAFACGTILGDVMLHMLPYLFEGEGHSHGSTNSEPHSHDSHGATPAAATPKPPSCPFAGKSGEIPTDSNHSHLFDSQASTSSTPQSLFGESSGHGHSHNLENMIVPLMIIGGVLIFLILDFAFMHVHSHDHDHDDHSHSHKKDKADKSKHSTSDSVELKELNKSKVDAKKDGKAEKDDSKAKQQSAPASTSTTVAAKKDNKHKKEEHEEEEHSAIPFLIGDFLHNFTDGIAVGAAYTVSIQMGVMSTLVIMIHELPHEIGDFAHLIKLNYSLGGILKTQFLTSLGALIGGFLGLATGEIYKKELLSVTAGGFLYMCLTQVLPEILHELKKNHSWENLISTVCAMGFGVMLMYEVALME